MKPKLVWAEIDMTVDADVHGLHILRIFKSRQAAFRACLVGNPARFNYGVAVGNIRRQLWLRSKGECELCGTPITEQSGEMHERQHRGKGGEISMENSVFACRACHRKAHADRNPRWSKKRLDKTEGA